MEVLSKTLPAVFPTGRRSGERCEYHPTHFLPCGECQEQKEYEEAERRRVRLLQAKNTLESIKLGRRYHGKTFDEFQPVQKDAERVSNLCRRYAETFQDRLTNGDSLLMVGNPGTGKNLLAACICNAIALDGFSALHTTAIKVVRKIKDSWNSKAEEQGIIDEFAKPDLLVIDEVGVQFGSKTEILLLTEVINERYEHMKPSIIISNLPMKDAKGEDLEKYLGIRAIDRFYEGKSAVLEFTWDSYRRRQG